MGRPSVASASLLLGLVAAFLPEARGTLSSTGGALRRAGTRAEGALALVAGARDAGISAGEGSDDVTELKAELQEAQAEDETNERIIEALLAKQRTLKAQVAKLGAALKKGAQEEGNTGLLQRGTSQAEVEALRSQVSELTARADANAARADQAVKELAAARETIARLQAAPKSGRGGHALASPKLALLATQVSDQTLASQEQASDEQQDGALSAVQQLSQRMFAESQEVGTQMKALTERTQKYEERLTTMTHRAKEAERRLAASQAEIASLRQAASMSGQERSALARSASSVDEALERSLGQVRMMEQSLKAGTVALSGEAVQASAGACDTHALQEENKSLRRAGAEVMHKYDLLSRDFQKQQQWIAAVEAQQQRASMAQGVAR